MKLEENLEEINRIFLILDPNNQYDKFKKSMTSFNEAECKGFFNSKSGESWVSLAIFKGCIDDINFAKPFIEKTKFQQLLKTYSENSVQQVIYTFPNASSGRRFTY